VLASRTYHSVIHAGVTAAADPSQQDVRALAIATRAIGQTNSDIWLEVIEYAPSAVAALSGTCRMLHEISKFNDMWLPLCRARFPRVHAAQVMEQARAQTARVAQEREQGGHTTPAARSSAVNWKSLVQQKDLMLQVRTAADHTHRTTYLTRPTDPASRANATNSDTIYDLI
jgi:hypothetical protein